MSDPETVALILAAVALFALDVAVGGILAASLRRRRWDG